MQGVTEGSKTSHKKIMYTCDDGVYCGAIVRADGIVEIFIGMEDGEYSASLSSEEREEFARFLLRGNR
jgi:hypothetical protein